MIKRIFDESFAAFGLLLLLPFGLAVAALVKLEDGGPLLYRGLRVGLRGRRFFALKFRFWNNYGREHGNNPGGDAAGMEARWEF